ncbi:hypothetical protein ACSQ67_007736 [Phaseolus vulgaris]
MANLFSLSGGRGSNNNQQDTTTNNEIPAAETLFWYAKNDDVSSYRGFELWNQQQEQHVMPPHVRPSCSEIFTRLVWDPAEASPMITPRLDQRLWRCVRRRVE